MVEGTNRPTPDVLPIPREDLINELLVEYFSDRNGLVTDFFERLQKENPALIKIATSRCFTSPEPETSLMYTSVYYLLYSRAASESGVNMTRVSDTQFDAFFHHEGDEIGRLDLEDENTMFEFWEKKEISREDLIDKEMSKSPALAIFWVNARFLKLNRMMVYGNNPQIAIQEGERIDQILSGVFDIQTLLHTQEEANKLGRYFS